MNLQFLIDPTPSVGFSVILPLLVAFAILFLIGILVSTIKKLKAIFWLEAIAQWLRWLGFLGLLFTFFLSQDVIYLAMPIWLVVLGFGFLVWLVAIVRNLRTVPQQLKQQTIRQETYDKYLPRPKQKRRKA
jgi:hypothetical protein